MKKTLVAKLALAGTVGLVAALASGTADAASCVACHTMHNSQDNSSMRFDGGATPLPILLRDGCIGCHTQDNTGASLLIDPPGVIGKTPRTYGASGTGNTLAGGDFWWVTTDDSFGHNVSGVIGQDQTLFLNRPGANAMTAQLECAGTNGCHGNPADLNPLTSLRGAHHFAHNDITDTLAATNPGNSFRYLMGTQGREDTDWEFVTTLTDHNRYAGTVRTTDTDASAPGPINSVCAKCHSSFHTKGNTNEADNYGITDGATFGTGQWIRHPTDYDMSATGEFAGYSAYSVEAPVGRSSSLLADAGNIVTQYHRIVLCVSCHRAHGSPNADMLRWDYSTMLVGTGVTTGCMQCHTAK